MRKIYIIVLIKKVVFYKLENMTNLWEKFDGTHESLPLGFDSFKIWKGEQGKHSLHLNLEKA